MGNGIKACKEHAHTSSLYFFESIPLKSSGSVTKYLLLPVPLKPLIAYFYSNGESINLFSLYVRFSHCRPCNSDLREMFLSIGALSSSF